MNDNHWYPRDPQRYLTDTAWCDHATEVAHVRLIDTYYALGKPIKDIAAEIQNIGKIKDSDYNRVRGNLERLGWRFESGELRHKRIEETLFEMESSRLAQIQRTKAATEARQKQRDDERNEQRNVVPTTTTTTTTYTDTAKSTDKGDAAKPPYEEILNFWNSNSSVRCLLISTKRRQSIEIRWKEKFFVDNWQNAILKISKSSFCCGDNERGWKATFDWFIQRDSVVKIMEGKYDGNKNQRNGSSRKAALRDSTYDASKEVE